MEKRRRIAAEDSAEERLRQSEARLRLAQQVSGVGTFEWDIRRNVNRWSPEIERLYGIPEGSFGGTYEDWAALVHPDDLAIAEQHVQEALKTGDFEAEWRIVRPDGEVVWLLARAIVEKDAEGNPVRMIGANFDISARVRAEEHQRMLMMELDHRVKNVLAVVQAIAIRSLSDAGEDVVSPFLGRLSALARSHDLLSETRWKGVRLRRLIASTVDPYRQEEKDNICLGGPDIQITSKAAQSLALAIQELVTNAAKYGALSVEDGQVEIEWSVRDDGEEPRLMIIWRESSGPPIVALPEKKGFGTQIIEKTVAYDLRGSAELDFSRTGLVATLALPLSTTR